MKKLCYILLVLGGSLCAQPIVTPQVINAAGGHHVLGSTNVTVSDNVGEPFTETLGAANAMVTQGFLQPDVATSANFSVTVLKNDLTCTDLKDGKITTAISGTALKYTAQYIWTPTVVCPTNDCTGLDSLDAGMYGLSVVFTYTNLANQVVNDTVKAPLQVVADVNGPCKVKVFTGVTINNDGKNDFLYIENISAFPNNRLTIYNRWGGQLYDKKGYDNNNTVWPSTDEQGKLLPSTYFYVLDLGDGSKPIKGWLELIKN